MSLLIGCAGTPAFVAEVCSRLSRGPHPRVRWRQSWGAIACNDGADHMTAGGLGKPCPIVVSGRVHERLNGKGGLVSPEIVGAAGRAILDSGGGWLTENVWGRYVIAVADEDAQRLSIFRDPTGLHTVFHASCPQGSVFATQLDALAALGVLPLSVDAESLASFVLAGTRPTPRMPLAGVSELCPGTVLEWSSRGTSTRLFWNPAKFIAQSVSPEPDVLWKVFAGTVAAVVGEQVEIGVDVSGGLDSSALLAAVGEAVRHRSVRVKAVTLHHPDSASATELPFARELAEFLGAEMVEVDFAEGLPFASLEETLTRKWDRPTPHMLTGAMHRAQHAGAASACCLLNGFGGDQVFQARGDIPHFLADHCLAGDFGKFGAELSAESTNTGTPYLPLLWKSLLIGLRQRRFATYWQPLPPPAWAAKELTRAAAAVISAPSFWNSLEDVSPAKRAQLFEIYDASALADRHFRSPEHIVEHPFLAQPVVELALALPMEALLSGSDDRILFRRAVAGRIPQSIVERHAKGDHSGIYQLGLQAHQSVVEELLMEGWLVANRLVGKEALRDELLQAAQGYTPNLWPILNAVAVELWIRSWQLF
ncbi:MAG: asparagine synthase-related protein [Chthoniobacter sp.]|uniref:asparagine synthase-related protein n=1 Tax=Chthoniobacter sp. TaxID=2510640 RepID=UPI0032A9650C